MSFNRSLTWDFPLADAHSMECGEQLKRSILHGIVQFKFRLRHTVHHWILLPDAQWPAFPVRSELEEKNEIKTRSETCRKNAITKDAQSLRSQNTFTLRRRKAGAHDPRSKQKRVLNFTKTLTPSQNNLSQTSFAIGDVHCLNMPIPEKETSPYGIHKGNSLLGMLTAKVSILNISPPNMQFRKADAHLRQ